MAYKVLFIDDDAEFLSERLSEWNNDLIRQSVPNNPLIKFVGLSFLNNDDPIANNNKVEMHYTDIEIPIESQGPASIAHRGTLIENSFSPLIEKIIEIQPDAILLDIHLGHGAILSGSILLNRIRRYYPYMPIIMTTRRADEVKVGMERYPTADGLLNLLYEGLADVAHKCSKAIDYRGIPKDVYDKGTIDPRLPDLYWGLLTEIVSNFFIILYQQTKHSSPIIFLQGEFGSSRRLFALWTRALLHKRQNKQYTDCLPSRITELNCACFRMSFSNDTDRKKYLKVLFSASEGDVLFLTAVDKVPGTMREAFITIVEEWRQKACIIATATDNERIGIEKLPVGIKKINEINCADIVSSISDTLISYLPPGLISEFEGRLETSYKDKYKIVDCKKINYDTPSFDNEKIRVQQLIESSQGDYCNLAILNIGELDRVADDIKVKFRQWIDEVRKNTCVIIQGNLGGAGIVKKLLPQVLPEYDKIDIRQNNQKLNVRQDKVIYCVYMGATGGKDFEVFLADKLANDLISFDCRLVFNSSPNQKRQHLKDQIMLPNNCSLLFLKNVDDVPALHVDIFKTVVEECKERFQVVATVADSNHLSLENLPKDNSTVKINLLSLQDIFNGKSFSDCNDDLSELLEKIFPTWEDLVWRLSATHNIHPEINKCYQDRLTNIVKGEENSQRKIRNTIISLVIAQLDMEESRFFEELCESIINRIYMSQFNETRGAITQYADILLAVQMHDWPEIIFGKTRSIYDLEEILRVAIRKARSEGVEANTHHIQISDYAVDAENIIDDRLAATMPRRPELGFELLTRCYAKIGDPDIEFNAQFLIEGVGGNINTLRPMNIRNPLNRIIESVQQVLEIKWQKYQIN